MIRYVSTRGGIDPVGFDQAVLQGFAEDGGLFVPQDIPRIPEHKLSDLSRLSYQDLCLEMLSYYISQDIIPKERLQNLIRNSYAVFEHPDLMPLVDIDGKNALFSMELFHGPTLSFKDIAMGFLMNAMDYFLQKKGSFLSIILATTGDTGPAAAYAAMGKPTIECWPLYPAGMISSEQERQMTTLGADNVHPVAVKQCKDGGDDIDRVVAGLFRDSGLKQRLRLSSVNSINWCRVMVQSVHYAYGYFRACDRVGDPVNFCVPSGAFGNLFAGFLAREMGIPIGRFICANNQNQTLHTVFSTGVFKKEDLCTTLSSAIDIVVPYNFWRYLYFCSGSDPVRIKEWMERFEKNGEIRLDNTTRLAIQEGVDSYTISDETTLATLEECWNENGYLLDPHGAVAVAAAKQFQSQKKDSAKVVCLATAHPAKFPDVIQKAFPGHGNLPPQARHSSLDSAKQKEEKFMTCDIDGLEQHLIHGMTQRNKERS